VRWELADPLRYRSGATLTAFGQGVAATGGRDHAASAEWRVPTSTEVLPGATASRSMALRHRVARLDPSVVSFDAAGSLLLLGGDVGDGPPTWEVLSLDAERQTDSPESGPMPAPRRAWSGVMLPGGEILVAPWPPDGGAQNTPTWSFDPRPGHRSFRPCASLPGGVTDAQLVPHPKGAALLAADPAGRLQGWVYEAARDSWRSTTPPRAEGSLMSAVTLRDGSVFVLVRGAWAPWLAWRWRTSDDTWEAAPLPLAVTRTPPGVAVGLPDGPLLLLFVGATPYLLAGDGIWRAGPRLPGAIEAAAPGADGLVYVLCDTGLVRFHIAEDMVEIRLPPRKLFSFTSYARSGGGRFALFTDGARFGRPRGQLYRRVDSWWRAVPTLDGDQRPLETMTLLDGSEPLLVSTPNSVWRRPKTGAAWQDTGWPQWRSAGSAARRSSRSPGLDPSGSPASRSAVLTLQQGWIPRTR